MGYTLTLERKFTIDGIDAKSVANTLLWNNNGATDFVISGGAIRCTAASGITVGPTIGLGSASGTNDILSPVAILALIAAGKTFNFSMIGMSITIPPGGNLYANLTNAATGTSQVVSIDITGYFT